MIDVELDGGDAGGRFKKEVVVDGQSYLLLIRDEGGPPDMQVCQAFVECLLPECKVIISSSGT